MKGYGYVYNFVLGYKDSKDRERRITLDYENIDSIGYNDGYDYGIKSGYRNDLVGNLTSIYYPIALQKQETFIKYKKGFLDGCSDGLEKYNDRNPDFCVIPLQEIESIEKVGYYDGYCFYLSQIYIMEKDKELGIEFYIDENKEMYKLFQEAVDKYDYHGFTKRKKYE